LKRRSAVTRRAHCHASSSPGWRSSRSASKFPAQSADLPAWRSNAGARPAEFTQHTLRLCR
jgi:hypothetical protein